jgi:hypothetical protein
MNEVKPLRDLPGSKVNMEIFTGLDFRNNTLSQTERLFTTQAKNDAASETKQGAPTYVIGIGLNRSLGRRFFLPAQFMYSGPQLVYQEVHQGSARISSPTTTGQTFGGAVYQQFTEVLDISTTHTMRLAAGLGYRLLCSPVFTASALLEGELDRNTSLRKNTVTFGNDGSIPQSPPVTALANVSSGYDPPSSTETTSSKYALMAGLHAARRLGPQVALTARITYHQALQSTELMAKSAALTIRPKNLMLCLGLNYRFK